MSNPSPTTLRFLGFIKQPQSPTDSLELHESDVVWSFSTVPLSSDSFPPSAAPAHSLHRRPFTPAAKSGLSAALSDDHHHLIRRKSSLNRNMNSEMEARFPQSAPVKIPAWPKGKLADSNGFDDVEEDEGEADEEIVPPHVIVARSHVTFSVFEGVGRTLKGRDLRRVRNAVFQKTGFID